MNAFAIAGLSFGVSSFIVGVFTLIKGERRIHTIWGWFCFSVAWWGFGMYKVGTTLNGIDSIFWWKIAEVGVIFIPILLTHFVINFLDLKRKLFLIIFYITTAVFIYFDLFTNYFVNKVYFIFDQFYYISATPLYSFLISIFIGSVVYVILELIRAYKKGINETKAQIKYLILAFVIGFSGGITSFLPVFGLKIYPVWNATIFISAFLVAYAILKYRLFDIKIILTQFVILVLWVVTLVKIFLAKGWQEVLIEGGFLIFLIIFGVLLIRSVLREVHQREKLEILTKTLEATNEKLKILDKTKSEFLSFASHQVKSPMSIVKGYATLIFDGTLGPVSNEIKDVAKKIKNSADRLISLVNNLLDLRKIEEGKMDFSFEEINIVKVVRDIAEELKILAKDRKLELTFESSKEEIIIKLDTQKFSQVIQNIIDNAIKYTEKGWIKVSVDIIDGKDVLIAVADSGRGISKELKSKMFEQFSRDSSVKKEIQGTGLGLYIAKQIVVAHQGQIWAESEGDNKGSKFMVKLPIANQRFDL